MRRQMGRIRLDFSNKAQEEPEAIRTPRLQDKGLLPNMAISICRQMAHYNNMLEMGRLLQFLALSNLKACRSNLRRHKLHSNLSPARRRFTTKNGISTSRAFLTNPVFRQN